MSLGKNILRARGRLHQLRGELESLKQAARGDIMAVNDVLDGLTPFMSMSVEDLESALAQAQELLEKRRRAETVLEEIQKIEAALSGS